MSLSVEKFYKGQYLTFTDKGLVDPEGINAIVGWDVQQYEPGYYPIGDTIQLSSNITCNAYWEETYTTYEVKFFANDKQYGKTQYVQRGKSAIEPYPRPTPSNPHKFFAGWKPSYTNITANTNCIAQFAELLSIFFMTQLGSEDPILLTCNEYIPTSQITWDDYPEQPKFQYYTLTSIDPEPRFEITSNTFVTYSYLSNRFHITNEHYIYDYDGNEHGLQITAEMNNHPGNYANVQFSKHSTGPWIDNSPPISERGSSLEVFFKLQYENYEDFIGSRIVRIGVSGCNLKFTFKDENGNDSQIIYEAEYGKKFTIPDDLTSLYIGHTFLNWYDQYDDPSKILDNPITADASLTAKYAINSYTCHFFNEDRTEWIKKDSTSPTNITQYQHSFQKPDPFDTTKDLDPKRYLFLGWYDYYNISFSLENDLNYAIRDLSAVAKYGYQSQVIFNLYIQAQTTYKLTSLTVDNGYEIDLKKDFQLPLIDNYTFDHYDPPYDTWAVITANTDVTAIYSDNFRIATFHANWLGASTQSSALTGISGTIFDETPFNVFEEERPGYSISSWNTDEYGIGNYIDLYNFQLLENIDYYAQWEWALYIIYYNTLGGIINTGADLTSYHYGDSFDLPSDVTMDENIFQGWLNENGNVVTKILPTDFGSKKFKAKWKYYFIIFDANGGDTPNPEKIQFLPGQTINKLAICTRDSYVFDGWYTAPDEGEKISEPYKVTATENIKFYAHWNNPLPTYQWVQKTLAYTPEEAAAYIIQQKRTNVGTYYHTDDFPSPGNNEALTYINQTYGTIYVYFSE